MLTRRAMLSTSGALLAAAAIPAATYADSPIGVVASNWKFTPSKLTVPAGKPTTLRLTSSEGVHGIESAQLGIPQTVLAPGKSTDITFTPSKAGTYAVHCSVMCGAGHSSMALTVEVT